VYIQREFCLVAMTMTTMPMTVTCIQIAMTGWPSVTEVCRRAVHQSVELLFVRALRMVCFHVRGCMIVCGTTRCNVDCVNIRSMPDLH